VSQRGKDIFGDTVNLALRLVDEAKAGQIVTSGDTAQNLSPAVQDSVRPLRSITVQGTDRSLLVGEFIWRRDPAAPLSLPTAHIAPIRLKLAYGVIKWVLRRAHDRLSIGRDTDCDLAVRDAHASRRHCTIARSNAGFILQDHSSNGTFVTTDGGNEVRLRKAEFSLGNRGWIAFGQSRAHTNEVVEYWCLRD
jgi:adenylate cyclase